MSDNKADIEADIKADFDRGETVSMIEPMLISGSSRYRGGLADLAVELASKSTGLRKSLPEPIVTALSDLVRSMNCYYSNLIEGHDTHPIDIEKALNEDYNADPEKRDLQLEARAHIAVQKWIDEGGLKNRAVSTAGILETHYRFCSLMPDDLLWVEYPETGERVRVVPGELRTRDVKVGRHVAVSPAVIPDFMARIESAYSKIGTVDSILSSATAHHRLLWVHPFLDGNGRVARLMSYAILFDAIDTGGLWSIARGLARNEKEYKSRLAACDLPRRNDLDGRGNLSEEELAGFTMFFLKTCIDQVEFMETLVEPARLRGRIRAWAEEEIKTGILPPKSTQVLDVILYKGELERGEVAELLGVTSRHARRITSALANSGVLVSTGARAPFRLAFPATLASQWTPGLFPDKI
ncbi:MAG: Fic family protein [Robiginitomaculum sp.]|nr:Fic family protein [Robiginitomaculum sp.]